MSKQFWIVVENCEQYSWSNLFIINIIITNTLVISQYNYSTDLHSESYRRKQWFIISFRPKIIMISHWPWNIQRSWLSFIPITQSFDQYWCFILIVCIINFQKWIRIRIVTTLRYLNKTISLNYNIKLS